MTKTLLVSAVLLITSGLVSAQSQRELKNPLVNSAEVIRKGVELHDAGKYKDAIAMYNTVSKSDTNYADILHETILSQYADSNYDGAEKTIKVAMDMFPEKKNEWMTFLADIYDDTRREDKAIGIYDEILGANKYDYLTFFNKGVSLFRQEKLDDAIKCFQQCVMLNPYYASGHYYLGLAALHKGNLVESLMSFSTTLLISPGGNKYKKTLVLLVALSQMNDDVMNYVKKYKPGREDNFQDLQDILISKIALDKKYKLKADLEDPIVRQLQAMLEKLEYNESDKGFWMQYYVPLYKKLWDEKQFEPLIFSMFSELQIDEVKSYQKKNKKHLTEMADISSNYFNDIRESQTLILSQRPTAKTRYYVKNYKIMGKGQYSKNDKGESMLTGDWEFYFSTGTLRSKGRYDDQGNRVGEWRYYYEDGSLKEVTNFRNDKAEGKSETWHDNGLLYISTNYKDNLTDGTETMYYYNGNLRSVIKYVANKKQGAAKYYAASGYLSTTVSYNDDKKQGEQIDYYRSGKIESKANYVNNEVDGEYKEYHENGQLKKIGKLENGKKVGDWKWFYDDGKPEYTATYVNDEMDGEYVSYFRNGKVETKASYRKGDVEKKEEFDRDGVLYCETVFERNRLREIRFLDKKGNEIANTSSRKGNAEITFYTPDGRRTHYGYFTKEGYEDGDAFNYFRNGKTKSKMTYAKGLMQGKKTDYYANGKVEEESFYKDNELDGYTIKYYNNGVVSSEGWYVGGNRQGTFLYYNELGQLTSRYYYLDDKVHGYADYFHANGKPYYSEFYDNGWLKKVIQYDTLGNVYNKSILAKGEGKVIFKHFNGKPYFENNYQHYNMQGIRTSFNGDGSKMQSNYYEYGNYDSIYRSWYPNGKLRLEGKYEYGDKVGTWKYYWPNGTLSETEEYVDGRLHGLDVQYREDGSVDKEINFAYGNIDGTYKYFGDNKQLAAVLYYNNDVLTGFSYEDKDGKLVPAIPIRWGTGTVTAYFKNGNKSLQITYNESKVDGERILYFSNGKEYVNGRRVDGDEDGVKKVYFPSGKLQKEENYLYGELSGTIKEYAENGALISEENYVGGDLHGPSKYYENGKLAYTLIYYYGILEDKK